MTSWVFFDFDGTLVDSLGHAWHVFRSFLEERGVEATHQEFDDLSGRTLDEIVHAVRGRHRLTEPPADLERAYRRALTEGYGDVRPVAGADDLLIQVRAAGRRVALVTAARGALAVPVLEATGWDSLFDVMILGDDLLRAKPDPEPYLLALRRARADPGDAVVVEDSSNGIQAARRAGLRVVAIGSEERARSLWEAGATAVVPRLADAGPALGLP